MADAVTDIDIVVVGAGAAGLGAAQRTRAAGRSVIVLEARARIGGRAQTVVTETGLPLDLGCGWLHSADRNPWVALARERGFTIDETLPGWGERLLRLGFSAADQADWLRSRIEFQRRREAASDGPDRPVSAFLEPGNRWNTLLDAISTWANGAELDRISARDVGRYQDSGINWRVAEGYGALIADFGADLPVRLEAPVERIAWGAGAVEIEGAHGTMRARAAIVTVSTAVLAAEAIRFSPALPPEKLAAAHGLPLGVDDKVFFGLAGEIPGAGANAHYLGSLDRVATCAIQVKPHGRPLVEVFFGGRHGLMLERSGKGAITAFALDEIAGLFGNDIRRRLTPLAHSAWATDPYAGGGYSYARPGHAEDRAILAAPLDNRLFFAGEACSPDYFSTAHGAYLSGLAAADQAVAVLGRR